MSKILIIYTGGTVGMIYDDKTKALRPIGFNEIRNNLPELYRMGIDFYVYAFNPPIDSSDMQPEIWVELASIIEDRYDRYDGFVILHGSDTMAFTASALSFMLENLSKPVILTGSQLPIGKIRTDAKENIITAMEIACSRHNGSQHSMVPEVCIYFDFSLFRGNRSKKYNAEKFEAFYTMNYPQLAEAGIDIKYKQQFILPTPTAPLKVHKELETNITVLKLFPGISRKAVEATLSVPGLKGVIMETFGSGNTNTQPWFIESIKKVIDNGAIVVDITQCDGGSVELGKYETSQHLVEAGVVSGHDMTFEAAVTKLMFVLGQGLSKAESRQMIETSLRGELTPIEVY
ncbi:asparaginase [Chitinophaga qingshengii]|uniref:Type I asparaginase n=1 Tax=Chitinophaga qingshengii TaxID=1569794 RepID=A0ABR7TL22_9BACT|nr:type I asparaginase [Chitinophaga qingshengii]MBC9931191.1 type I asparaginase [Chitinophaga qingshengii]